MPRHSFTVSLDASSPASLNIASKSDATMERFSVWQQTMPISAYTGACSCDAPASLGTASISLLTSTNANIYSVGEWTYGLSFSHSPAKGLASGLLAVNFALQNYKYDGNLKNQIVWSPADQTVPLPGVFYNPVATAGITVPNFYVPGNAACASVIGTVEGFNSSGIYVNSRGTAKLTYFSRAGCNVPANTILIEFDLELAK